MGKNKILTIAIITVLTVIFLCSNTVNAAQTMIGSGEASGSGTSTSSASSSKQVVNPGKFKPDGSAGDNSSFVSIANKVISIIQYIGSIISVIVLIVIGIKYMLGSIEERAEYKKSMKPYLIGAIILFGSSNLLQIIYKLATNISGSV